MHSSKDRSKSPWLPLRPARAPLVWVTVGRPGHSVVERPPHTSRALLLGRCGLSIASPLSCPLRRPSAELRNVRSSDVLVTKVYSNMKNSFVVKYGWWVSRQSDILIMCAPDHRA